MSKIRNFAPRPIGPETAVLATLAIRADAAR
jgi:hypothetical protein